MDRKMYKHVLATTILVVAVVNYKPNGEIFDWAAYIGTVPGYHHEDEMEMVAKEGTKLGNEIAEALFCFPIEKYRK